ncbi:MAG: LCP family protein [Chloroflexota bacterium]
MPSTGRPGLWFRIGILAGFALASLTLGVAVHLIVRDLTEAWTGTGITPFQFSGIAGSTPAPGGTETSATALPPAVEPQPWSGYERVTVLIMGLDYRDWIAGQGPPRTDSMMVISYDPITRQASMLSIPRDLYVEIPGFGHDRINTAYPRGEASRLPGGGAGLAMQTVENLIGVPIQYYMIIEFSAFERMIDEIGGIDVLVPERIKISPIGRQSMWLEAKPYHLDGAEALAYARVRSGPQGDFGRARRQQQVALAILDRLLAIDVIPTLFARAPALYQELSAGIRTNLTLDQMVSLGWMAYQIPRENIHSGVIAPPSMVGFHTLSNGASVLRPVPDQIRILRDQLFVGTSALSPTFLGLLQPSPTP